MQTGPPASFLEVEAFDLSMIFTGAGIGRDALTLARWSLELGGHCRTGMEDNVRLDRDRLAPSNAALVRQVAELAAEAGRRVATTEEARQIWVSIQ